MPRPRQVFAIGMNYGARRRGRRRGAGVPPTFTKFPTCLTGPDATVALPSALVDWEVELVAVIGPAAYEVEVGKGSHARPDRRPGPVGADRADATACPAVQPGKSFLGFGPTGPWVITPDELDHPDDLAGLHRERRGGAEEPHRI